MWLGRLRPEALPEIQYLKATISEEQRQEFGRLVDATIRQIEAGQFSPTAAFAFPRTAASSCSHLGLCLGTSN